MVSKERSIIWIKNAVTGLRTIATPVTTIVRYTEEVMKFEVTGTAEFVILGYQELKMRASATTVSNFDNTAAWKFTPTSTCEVRNGDPDVDTDSRTTPPPPPPSHVRQARAFWGGPQPGGQVGPAPCPTLTGPRQDRGGTCGQGTRRQRRSVGSGWVKRKGGVQQGRRLGCG
jgi:hypothetical protein